MGELVFWPGGAMELYVVITRDTDHEDLVGPRVDRDNHVYITTGNRADVAGGINATNIDIERVFGNVDIFR